MPSDPSEFSDSSTPSSEAAPADSGDTEPSSDHRRLAPAPSAALEFPVVGIGASAGGLEALEALIARLSNDSMAYVILQHLSPGHESMLTEILSRKTSMRVVTIVDGMPVDSNTIYVSPPNADVTLEDGRLRLARPALQVPRHSIDAFFRSLSAAQQTRAIGVVLSGAGTDGTLGLRAIKEDGGITFAQEPGTASHPSMPQSAIDAGCADFCLNPAHIGDELMRLSAHPYVARKRSSAALGAEGLKRLFEQLRRSFGVDFSAYKPNTVARRIERRMALQKIDRLDDYLRFVEVNSEELGFLYSDLLIGVTGFFRDREPFEALKTIVFPRLLDQRSTDTPIRIWVPGCTTGEEAYSVAICLLEFLDGRAPGYKIQVFGTDIDDRALARARQAQYPANIEIDVSPERLQRYFSRFDKGFQVSRQIRDMVVFARHNLGKDPPFSRLDLISCRNVLIYMQPPLQRKVLRVFHYALNPDGCLLIGTSESVGDASDMFSLLDRKLKIYLKKNTASPAVFDFAFTARHDARTADPNSAARVGALDRRPMVTMQQLADRKVLEKFGPPGLLLDETMEVVQFRGQMGPYLAPSPGVATLNVLKLVRPELLVELRTTLQRALSEGLPVVSSPAPLLGDKAGSAVVFDVTPLHEATAQRRGFLALFREAPLDRPVEELDQQVEESERRREPHIHDLERELLVTREYLQTSVQELEAANEELQSSNEELQSSNEELQSTNEELETSKEELQSTNEELATVNEELQTRMAELSLSNDDLNNVLSSVSMPYLIVGKDLRIRRFSADASRLLNLISGDLGRPIGYLGGALNAPQIESMVSETINSVRERSQRVRCSDGHWYTARTVPYRTADHAIVGAIIEFLKAPPARKIGDVPEIHELVGKVLSTLPHMLMVLDEDLRILWVNKAFFEAFVLGAEIVGRSLDEVWPAGPDHRPLWSALEETASGKKPFDDIVVPGAFGRSSERKTKFSARFIPSEGDRSALTLLMLENIGKGTGAS